MKSTYKYFTFGLVTLMILAFSSVSYAHSSESHFKHQYSKQTTQSYKLINAYGDEAAIANIESKLDNVMSSSMLSDPYFIGVKYIIPIGGYRFSYKVEHTFRQVHKHNPSWRQRSYT